MPPKWSIIEADPEYRALSGGERIQVKQRYFDSVISSDPDFSSLDDSGRKSVRDRFFGLSGPAEVAGPSPVVPEIPRSTRRGLPSFDLPAGDGGGLLELAQLSGMGSGVGDSFGGQVMTPAAERMGAGLAGGMQNLFELGRGLKRYATKIRDESYDRIPLFRDELAARRAQEAATPPEERHVLADDVRAWWRRGPGKTQKEMIEKHPVAAQVGSAAADLGLLAAASAIPGPADDAVIISRIGMNYPKLALALKGALRGAQTFGTAGILRGLAEDQDLGKAVTRGAKDAAFGAAVGAPGFVEGLALRTALKSAGAGGVDLLGSLYERRKAGEEITKEDILKAVLTAGQVAGLELLGAGRTKQALNKYKAGLAQDAAATIDAKLRPYGGAWPHGNVNPEVAAKTPLPPIYRFWSRAKNVNVRPKPGAIGTGAPAGEAPPARPRVLLPPAGGEPPAAPGAAHAVPPSAPGSATIGEAVQRAGGLLGRDAQAPRPSTGIIPPQGLPPAPPQPGRPRGILLPAAGAESARRPMGPAEIPDVSPRKEAIVLQDKGKFPVQRVPVASIKAKPEMLQFKLDVNAEGEQKPLKGDWNELAAGNLLLWEDINGNLYPANGHHRLAHARRKGVDRVNAQILREADGYKVDDARRIAAESNILEGRGTVYDHAEFFRTSPDYPEETARRKGLYDREGYAIGKLSSDGLYAAFRNRKIEPESAAVLAQAAPRNEALQTAGLKYALDHPKAAPDEIGNFVKALSAIKSPEASQGDLLGFDDSALRTAQKLAKLATQHIRSLREQVASAQGAAKRPETAGKLGVNVKDPAAVKAKLAQVKAQIYRWERWHTDPELFAQLQDGMILDEAAPEAMAVKETGAIWRDEQPVRGRHHWDLKRILEERPDFEPIITKHRPAAEKIIKAAAPKQAALKMILEGARSALPGAIVKIHQAQKSLDSLLGKVARKVKDEAGRAGYTANDPKDHVRGAIELKDFSDIPAAIRYLKGKMPAAKIEVRLRDPNIWGYAAIHLTAPMGDGINGEVQFFKAGGWKIKEQSDAIWGKWRYRSLVGGKTKAEYNKDLARSNRLWESYYRELAGKEADLSSDIIRSASSEEMREDSPSWSIDPFVPQRPVRGSKDSNLSAVSRKSTPSSLLNKYSMGKPPSVTAGGGTSINLPYLKKGVKPEIEKISGIKSPGVTTDLLGRQEPVQGELDLAFGGKDNADKGIKKTIETVEKATRRRTEGIPQREVGSQAGGPGRAGPLPLPPSAAPAQVTLPWRIPGSIKQRGKSIADFLRAKRFVDLRGLDASLDNVAQAFALHYRNPFVEHFHAIAVKNGKIVAHTAISSGAPDRVEGIFDTPDRVVVLHDWLKGLGADALYFLHNHPSGTHPSAEDRSLTARVSSWGSPVARGPYRSRSRVDVMRAAIARKLKGHVVIDHEKFYLIGRDGEYTEHNFPGPGKLENWTSLGRQISNPGEAAEALRGVIRQGNFIAVAFRGNGGKIAGVEIYRKDTLKKSTFPEVLKQHMRAHKASEYLIAGIDIENDIAAANHRYPNGLLDVIVLNPGSGYTSTRETGQWGRIRIAEDTARPAWRLFEPKGDYGSETPARPRPGGMEKEKERQQYFESITPWWARPGKDLSAGEKATLNAIENEYRHMDRAHLIHAVDGLSKRIGFDRFKLILDRYFKGTLQWQRWPDDVLRKLAMKLEMRVSRVIPAAVRQEEEKIDRFWDDVSREKQKHITPRMYFTPFDVYSRQVSPASTKAIVEPVSAALRAQAIERTDKLNEIHDIKTKLEETQKVKGQKAQDDLARKLYQATENLGDADQETDILTELEMSVIEQHNRDAEELLAEVNKIRQEVGERPIKRWTRTGYIKHILTDEVMNAMRDKGILDPELAKMMKDVPKHTVHIGAAQHRIPGVEPKDFEQDFWLSWRVMVGEKIRYKHLRSALEKIKPYMTVLKKHPEFNPAAFRMYDEWLEQNIKFRPSTMDELLNGMFNGIIGVYNAAAPRFMKMHPGTQPWRDVVNALSQWMHVGAMGFRVKAIIRNRMQSLLDWTMLGTEAYTHGRAMYHTKKGRELLKASDVYKSRTVIIGQERSAWRKVTDIGYKGYEWSDRKNMGQSMLSSYWRFVNKRGMAETDTLPSGAKYSKAALKKAEEYMFDTQWSYFREHMPKVFWSSTGRFAFGLTSWPMSYYNRFIPEMLHRTFKGVDGRGDPVRGTERWAALRWLLLVGFLAATEEASRGLFKEGKKKLALLQGVLSEPRFLMAEGWGPGMQAAYGLWMGLTASSKYERTRGWRMLQSSGLVHIPGYLAAKDLIRVINGDKGIEDLFLYTEKVEKKGSGSSGKNLPWFSGSRKR